MKLTQLTIAEVQVLGGTEQVRLHFAEKSVAGLIAIKPIAVLTGRFDPLTRDIVTLSPTMLEGATVTVEDSDYNGVQVKGVMESFKKGDVYILTEINSKVVNGEINPETNTPYQVGEKAVTESDGLTIRGNMNVKLHHSVVTAIEDEIRTQRIKMAISDRSTASRTSRRGVIAETANTVTKPIVDDNVETIDDAINNNIEGEQEEKAEETPKAETSNGKKK